MNKRFGFLTIALIVMAISSCNKRDGGLVPVNLTVKIFYNSADSTLGFSKENAVVKITNLTSGNILEAKTNAAGEANFASITPGNYTINAGITIAATVYSASSGTIVTDDVVYNGNKAGEAITGANFTVLLPLVTGHIGDWVIKQIYYAGSNTSNGASFRDQFIEFYNNSNETLYADSLYFGQVLGSNNTANNTGKPGYLPSNQYDWSVAIGNTVANANEDYTYLRSAYMVPGTGRQHPVKPGESIILAQTGVNHAQPYKLNDGVDQGITDPTLTIDLSKADFEAYLADYKRSIYTGTGAYTPYKFDVDNPAVPNIGVAFFVSGNDMILDNLGRDAYVIYKLNDIKPESLKSFPDPTVKEVSATTNVYLRLPKQYIIDAVEIQRTVESSRVPKKLQNSLDAGPTNVAAGEYSSQSIVRKTKRMVNGRRILQDTNNSANDFVTKQKADPSKTEASFAN